MAIAGFPISLVVAWALELTSEGVRPTPAAGDPGGGEGRREPEGAGSEERASPDADGTPGSFDREFPGRQDLALVVLALVVTAGAAWWILGSSQVESPQTSTSSSVAVLPFRDLGPSGPNGEIGLGVTDAVISELSLVDDLTPVARTEVTRFRDSPLSVGEIADSLNVEYLVEGSLQRSGDSIRIDARLVRAETGRPVWNRTFGGSSSRIFDLQSEVALAVIEALEARLGDTERRRIRERPTENPAAYELYLRAQELISEGPENEAAIEMLRQAIRLDSAFALAHAALSSAYDEQADMTLTPAFRDSALALARRAVEINPQEAEGHFRLGVAMQELGRMEASEQAYRRALALEPGHAWAMYGLGLNQALRGRPAEALRWYWRVLSHLPSHPYPRSAIAWILFRMGEDAAARAWWERALELGSPPLRRFLVHAALGRGDLEGARRHLEKLREWDANHPITLGYAGLLAQLEGDTAAALDAFRRAERRPPRESVVVVPVRLRIAQLLRASGSVGRSDSLVDAVVGDRTSTIEADRDPPRYLLAAAHQIAGDTARARAWLDSAFAAGARGHRAQRRDPIWRGVGYAQDHFDRIEANWQVQKAVARRWARDEGLDWPPFPPEREVRQGDGVDSTDATAAVMRSSVSPNSAVYSHAPRVAGGRDTPVLAGEADRAVVAAAGARARAKPWARIPHRR